MRGIADALAALAAAGFDIAHAFDAAAAATAPGLELLAGPGASSTAVPGAGSSAVPGVRPAAGTPRLGLLIGNTRALWPPFTAALADPALAADPDPLDRYTERTLDATFPGARIYHGHRRYTGGFLPLQRLAALTGLGALAPNHLVIHPIYGPWLALRAVVLVDGDGDPPPSPRAPIPQPCQCNAACATALATALQSMTAADWLAVRDRCALGAWRYSDDQIAYHYGRSLLGSPR
ncbi:MAG TPA: hypothetical protein VH165_29750 [Kofleriaceae bacterium]|nr:hypothetical protein [Kofleriaceae bacterium]